MEKEKNNKIDFIEFSTRIRKETKKRLRIYCVKFGITVQDAVDKAIDEYLKKRKDE